MERDFRYKAEHMGDYFVDMIEKITLVSKASARGVILMYDIRQLEKKKGYLIRDIGTRIAQAGKDNSSLAEDEKMIEMRNHLDETEKQLSVYIEERQNLLSPVRSSCSCGTKKSDTPPNS